MFNNKIDIFIAYVDSTTNFRLWEKFNSYNEVIQLKESSQEKNIKLEICVIDNEIKSNIKTLLELITYAKYNKYN